MKPGRIVKLLKNTKSRDLQKEIIKDAWIKCDYFFTGLNMSIDESISFKLEKIPAIGDGPEGQTNWNFDDFHILYDTLSDPEITDRKSKKLVIDAAMQSPIEDWNFFYRRILQKKLHEDIPMDIVAEVLSEVTGRPF